MLYDQIGQSTKSDRLFCRVLCWGHSHDFQVLSDGRVWPCWEEKLIFIRRSGPLYARQKFNPKWLKFYPFWTRVYVLKSWSLRTGHKPRILTTPFRCKRYILMSLTGMKCSLPIIRLTCTLWFFWTLEKTYSQTMKYFPMWDPCQRHCRFDRQQPAERVTADGYCSRGLRCCDWGDRI